jgi:hypothetical protein
MRRTLCRTRCPTCCRTWARPGNRQTTSERFAPHPVSLVPKRNLAVPTPPAAENRCERVASFHHRLAPHAGPARGDEAGSRSPRRNGADRDADHGAGRGWRAGCRDGQADRGRGRARGIGRTCRDRGEGRAADGGRSRRGSGAPLALLRARAAALDALVVAIGLGAARRPRRLGRGGLEGREDPRADPAPDADDKIAAGVDPVFDAVLREFGEAGAGVLAVGQPVCQHRRLALDRIEQEALIVRFERRRLQALADLLVGEAHADELVAQRLRRLVEPRLRDMGVGHVEGHVLSPLGVRHPKDPAQKLLDARQARDASDRAEDVGRRAVPALLQRLNGDDKADRAARVGKVDAVKSALLPRRDGDS